MYYVDSRIFVYGTTLSMKIMQQTSMQSTVQLFFNTIQAVDYFQAE